MVVDFSTLREFYAGKIVEALTKCVGDKMLVLDKGLTSLNLVANYSLFEKNQAGRICFISHGLEPNFQGISHVVFLTRPITKNIEIISDFMSRNRHHKLSFSLFCVPSLTAICMQKLSLCGIEESFVHLEGLPIYAYPIDQDLVSMENPDLFKNYLLEDDIFMITEVVNCVLTLEAVFGSILAIKGKGNLSQKVADILMNKNKMQKTQINMCEPQIDLVILVDRTTDMLTPLLTELSYEGLIRSNFEAPACKITLNPRDEKKENESRCMLLNSSNEFYVGLRYLMFYDALKYIRQSAKNFTDEFNQFMATKNVTDLKKAVSNYPVLRQKKTDIELNTDLANIISTKINEPTFETILLAERDLYISRHNDKIIPIIDQLVGTLHPISDVARLICLQSVLQGGLSSKTYEYYCHALIQAYGYLAINVIMHLDKMGLFKYSTDSLKYKSVSEVMKLLKLVDNRSSMSMFYHSYTPLSCKLVKYFIDDSLVDVPPRTIAESMKNIPGSTISITNSTPILQSFKSSSQNIYQDAKTVLVFFIGGCTSSEIGQLRGMQQDNGGGVDILFATTSIINTKTLIDFALQDINF